MRGSKADDSLLHEQERDVSKKWVRSLIHLAAYGVENHYIEAIERNKKKGRVNTMVDVFELGEKRAEKRGERRGGEIYLIQQVTKKLFFESDPEVIANGFAEDVDYIKRIIKAINSAGLGATADEVYNKLHEEE